MLHPEAKFADRWIKQKAQFSKERKLITFDKYDKDEIGINFSDFWTNLTQEDKVEDPRKTYCLITGKNLQIFSQIWNPITT